MIPDSTPPNNCDGHVLRKEVVEEFPFSLNDPCFEAIVEHDVHIGHIECPFEVGKHEITKHPLVFSDLAV